MCEPASRNRKPRAYFCDPLPALFRVPFTSPAARKRKMRKCPSYNVCLIGSLRKERRTLHHLTCHATVQQYMKTAGVFYYAIIRSEVVWKSPFQFLPTGIFWTNFASPMRSLSCGAAWKTARENLEKRSRREEALFYFFTD